MIWAESESDSNVFGGLHSERRYSSSVKCGSKKVWPEQEEAHEHRGHWLDKGRFREGPFFKSAMRAHPRRILRRLLTKDLYGAGV